MKYFIQPALALLLASAAYAAPPPSPVPHIVLTPGSDPTNPINGELWSTPSGFFGWVSGGKVGPFGGGGGSGCTVGAGASGLLVVANGSSGCQLDANASVVGGLLTLGTAGTSVGSVQLNNATSGSVTLKPPTGALGTSVITFPVGTTDFSATGGASQVVAQLTTGGPLITEQLSNTDIAGLGTAATANTGTSGATLPFLSANNTWSGVQSFNANRLLVKGVTSGTLTINVAAIAGANVITFPAGTTDFSATGGASQVVKQTSVGGAFTVARLACADLSDSGAGCTGSGGGGLTVGTSTITSGTTTRVLFDNAGVLGEYPITGSGNVVLSTSPTLVTPVLGAASATSLALTGGTVTGVTTPSAGTDAANKAYVDNIAAGLNPAVAVQAATTQASDTSSYTYVNGAAGIGATLTGPVNTAFAPDGFTFTTVGQRVLIKNDTVSVSGSHNGVYSITQVQTGILPVILTRVLDYDTPSDMNNTGTIPVVNGTANAQTSWLLTSTIATVGTDPLTFTQYTLNPTTVVTLSGTQTLTNKTISTASNTITKGTNSVFGTAEGDGQCVTLVNGVASTTVPNRTSTISATILATDMCGQVNFNGSSLTATIPAISGTVLASGMSIAINNFNATALTLASTPTINGFSGTSIPQYGGINCISNGASLDCVGLGVLANVMTLTGTNQSLSGGVNTVAFSLGVVTSGTTTPNCGSGPEQLLINGGAFTLAAPTTQGRCIVHVINGNSFGTVTLTGFFEGSSTGDAIPVADKSSATVTTAVASPGVVSWTAHGLIAGQPVYFTGGTLPTGITSGTVYYVISTGNVANGFEISATPGGAAINFTGTSSGTQTGHAASQYDLVIGNTYNAPHYLVSAYQ